MTADMTFNEFVEENTDRTKAVEALRQQQAILRTIIESTSDVIFMKDKEGHYVLMNSSGAQVLGLFPEDFVGKDDFAFFPREVGLSMQEVDERVMASGESYAYEQEVSVNGRKRTMFTTKSVCRDLNGDVIGLVGIAKDITERREAGRALEKSEQRLRSLFEASRDSILLVNQETGRILGANPAARQDLRLLAGGVPLTEGYRYLG